MIKNTLRANKILANSDGALLEVSVLDDLVSTWFDGEIDIDVDEMLVVCKRAQDCLKNLRADLKREAVSS